MRKRVVLSAILMGVLLPTVALVGTMWSERTLPPQPIAFNHRIHLERVQGIQCVDCHRFATSESFAGLPSKHLCFECHDPYDVDDPEADAAKPEFATLVAFSKTEDDIPWLRVTANRDDVFFSHRRHVVVGEIECRQCHPRIPERTTPLDRGPVQMSMSACIDCHERSESSVDCIMCHF